MNNQEYERTKRECFVQLCKDNGIDQEVNISIFDAFDQIFDRAYALGKQEKDAEREDEMLSVSRKRVQELYHYHKLRGHHLAAESLINLFGSKCLPDNVDSKEPKTAEPKFKVGARVRVKGCGYEPNLHKGDIGEILDTNDKEQCFVLFKKSQAWIYADCLEPYAAPTDKNPKEAANAFVSDDTTTTKSDGFDRIVKNGFRNHNRLHIAAMAMQGILSNPCGFAFDGEDQDKTPEDVAEAAFLYADALIAEGERTDRLKGE